MKRFLFLLTLALVAIPMWAIYSDELPFMSQVLRVYTPEEVHKLSHDMCFNLFAEYDTIGPDNIDMLTDADIRTIKGGIISWQNGEAEAPFNYSCSNYAIIDVGSPYPNADVRMEAMGGQLSTDVWTSNYSSDVLSGISTYQLQFSNNPERNRVAFDNRYASSFPTGGYIYYRADLKAAIDNPNPNSDDIVATATILVGKWNTCEMDTIHADTLLVSDFGNSSSLQWILGKSDFVIPDSINVTDYSSSGCDIDTFYTSRDRYGNFSRWSPYLRLDIKTMGIRAFQVDSIKISDLYGRGLMAGNFDVNISAAFDSTAWQGREDEIFAWFLMDEPSYANLLSFHHIDSLIHESYANWQTFTNLNRYTGGERLNHTYLSLVDVDYIIPDIYPFSHSNGYAGDAFQDTARIEGKKFYGSLFNLPTHISWVRKSVDEVGKDFWLTVQAFEDGPGGTRWRYPTPSELSVQIFIGLAWGCKGIQVWYYDQASGLLGRGLRDTDGEETELYWQMRNYISPYIQALSGVR